MCRTPVLEPFWLRWRRDYRKCVYRRLPISSATPRPAPEQEPVSKSNQNTLPATACGMRPDAFLRTLRIGSKPQFSPTKSPECRRQTPWRTYSGVGTRVRIKQAFPRVRQVQSGGWLIGPLDGVARPVACHLTIVARICRSIAQTALDLGSDIHRKGASRRLQSGGSSIPVASSKWPRDRCSAQESPDSEDGGRIQWSSRSDSKYLSQMGSMS